MRRPFANHVLLPRLLRAIGAASALPALVACGAVAGPEPTEEGSIVGSGGSQTSMQTPVEGGSSGQGMAPISPSEPSAVCDSFSGREGAGYRFCLGREEMERKATRGTGMVDRTPLRTEQEVQDGFDQNGCMRHDWVADSCCNPAVGPGEREGDECCYVSCDDGCCGRPLTIEGTAQVASLCSGSGWLLPQAPPIGEDCGATRGTVAELWAADALMEHASVASFARFSLQLLALGAPAHLLEAAQRAGLDEVRHAQMAFTIAHGLGGEALAPAALPQAASRVPTDLTQVVVATIIEGCIGETISAAVAQRQAEHCADPTVRAALEQIAEDETRHAELAWRFVAWALAGADEALVASAAATFEAALERGVNVTGDAGLSEATLHVYGRLTVAEQRQVHEQTLRHALVPAFEALMRPCRAVAARSASAEHARA